MVSYQKFQFGCDNNSSKFIFQRESVDAIHDNDNGQQNLTQHIYVDNQNVDSSFIQRQIMKFDNSLEKIQTTIDEMTI